MNNESSWNDLRQRAAARLPAGFSAQVLRQAVRVKRQRREYASAAVTLALCLSATGAVTGWQVYREHEKNLAQWRELAAVTMAMEKSL